MRRQDGQGIADRLVDLRLREVADLDQARAGDVSTGEVSPREIGLIEQSLRQVSAGKIGAIQTRLTKIGVGEAERLAPFKVAKQSEPCLRRAPARLTGPPLIWPICRSAALKLMPVRLGTVSGCSARHAFHVRGPRRSRSIW
jgi:hypothetical protein